MTETGSWPRCKDVVVEGDHVSSVLDYENEYDFVDAYERDAHLRLLEIGNEQGLAAFIKSFGPLFMTREDGSPVLRPGGTFQGVSSTRVYWEFQKWLRALLRLLEVRSDSRNLRSAVVSFVEAEIRAAKSFGNLRAKAPAGVKLAGFKVWRQREHPGSLTEWVRDAPDALIREIAAVLIAESIEVKSGFGARVKKRGIEVIARPKLRNLGDALEWMCWYDEFLKRPLVFCSECGKPFRPQSAHRRKYCDDKKCGQRVASRNYRRRERLKGKRSGQRNLQEELHYDGRSTKG